MSLPNALPPNLRRYGRGSAAGGVAGEISTPDQQDPSPLAKRLRLILVVGLYIAVLLWAYATIVSIDFAYEGFTLKWPGAFGSAWLITFALLPTLWLPYSLSRPSAVIVWWLYLSVYISAIFVPALSFNDPEKLLPLQITLLLCMGMLCWAATRPRLLAVPKLVLSPNAFWTIFWFFWGAGTGYILITGRVSSLANNVASLFHGANEYDIRNTYSQLLGQSGAVLAYIVGQLAQALNPFLIAYGLLNRRRICLILGIVGEIIVFSLTGLKAALAGVVFIAVLAVLFKRGRRSFGIMFTSALIALVAACTIHDRSTGDIYSTTLVTRRALMAPGLLTGFYFEHWSEVQPVGFGIHFSRDQSRPKPASEISWVYFDDPDSAANANLWASGFAEARFFGTFLYNIFAAIMIWLYDSVAARRNLALAALLAAMPATTLSNTAATTVLITHGGLAVGLLLFLAPSS